MAGSKDEPSLVLIIIGIVFIPVSFAFGVFENPAGITMFAVGVVFLIIGLGLKRQRRRESQSHQGLDVSKGGKSTRD